MKWIQSINDRNRGLQIVLRKPIVEVWKGCDLLKKYRIGKVYSSDWDEDWGGSRFELAYEKGRLVIYLSSRGNIKRYYIPPKSIWFGQIPSIGVDILESGTN